MRNLEMKVEAIMRFCVAETENDRADALAEIREMLRASAGTPAGATDVDATIRRILLDIGVPDRLKGHPYLVTALTIAVKDPAATDAFIKVLYPAVAQQHAATAKSVERAIRHAIEVAWDRGD